MVNLNEGNFNEHTNDGVVLVDFWAEWCGPCKMITPILEKVSTSFNDDDSVNIFKVNVDNEPRLAQKFGVTSIPTLAFIKNGEVVKTVSGVQPEATIVNALQDLKAL